MGYQNRFLIVFSRRFSRASFFSSDHRPHRVCTTFYRLHSRSHVLVSTRFTVNPAVTGSSPCFSQKLFRAIFSALCDSFNLFRHCATLIFFRHCATFFRNFFVAKGSPLKFFDILQQTEVSKNLKGPSLVFRHYEADSKTSFFVFFRKFFQKTFFNVSKGSPSTFLIFCNGLDFQKVGRGPPLLCISNYT